MPRIIEISGKMQVAPVVETEATLTKHKPFVEVHAVADAQDTPNTIKTKRCFHGHALTPDNVMRTAGRERCRQCQRAARRKWYATHGVPLRTREHVPSLIGKRFGRWTVEARSTNTPEGKSRWLCRCDCGQERVVPRGTLRNGTSQSCGCLNREINTRHGMSGSPAYNSWAQMMRRCVWELDFEGYSARGIRVCARWQVFENFFADLGERPPDKSIDRFPDNDGHYSCGKCDECRAKGWPLNARWATASEQMNNKRTNKKFTWNERTLSIAQWEKEMGITGRALSGRLLRGWTFERAVTTPFVTRTRAA